LRNSARYFYRVPWCVPAWGRREFLHTARSILTGRTARGPQVREAAESIREYLGVAHALPVNRGRTGIELGLRAMGLGAGDDVVLPSYVCRSVLDAVLSAGCAPVFADVGPDLNVTVESVEGAITARTKCVIVPHLFGNVAPVDEIERLLEGTGVRLLDDAAQSFGARRKGRLVGTFGACGVVSCGPGKTLAGAAGGLLVTNDGELYGRAAAIPLGEEGGDLVARRALSFWTWRRFRRLTLPFKIVLEKFAGAEGEGPHENRTLSNLDAGIMLEQLRTLDKHLRERRENAEAFLTSLGGLSEFSVSSLAPTDTLVKLILVLPECGPTVEEAVELLAQDGIECEAGYAPLHKDEDKAGPALPVTEALWARVLCLPLERGLKTKGRRLLLARKWDELRSGARTAKDDDGGSPRPRAVGAGPGRDGFAREPAGTAAAGRGHE
jgi:dTDP-4-amino-4,6-dideoxygalactose transaminase